jgi:hypothetical protein
MTATTVTPSVQQSITNLNAAWYNAVSAALRLDQSTFVLAQGGLGIQGTDSSGLFLMSDSVPPSASVTMYQPSGTSKFSSAYGTLLTALAPETDPNGLQRELGDMYASWAAYVKQYYQDHPDAVTPLVTVFSGWARGNLDPGRTARGVAVIEGSESDPLVQALRAMRCADHRQKFQQSDGTAYSLPRYTATLDAARSAINQGPSADLLFHSVTGDHTLRYTTERGAATGYYGIFGGSATESLRQLNEKSAFAEVTVEGRIGRYATLPTNPGAWFTSAEYTRAYHGRGDQRIWTSGATAGDWDSFFGQPTGALARRVSGLVLVSDYMITVTSKASYTQAEFQQIKAQATFGVWPFFCTTNSIASKNEFQRNDDGSISVTSTLEKGCIEIWGANVLQAPS